MSASVAVQLEPSYTPRFLTPEMLKGLKLVGISGEVGSGKSTLAKHLVRGYGFTPESLANPFKLDGIMLEGLPIHEVFGSVKSPETRNWLQKRGTEWGREVAGIDVWVHYLEAVIWYNIDHGVQHVVVPDVRFPNEVAAFKALGGVVYRLTGRGGAEGDLAKHKSERILDGFTGYTRYLDNSEGREYDVFYDLASFLFADLGVRSIVRRIA